MTYSYAQLEAIAKEGGFPDALLPIMAAIAMAESSGNPNAINPNDNGGRQTSWGLWQISDGTHNQPVPNILDPIVNAKAAYQKYQTQGLAAWGTYTSGAYKSYLQSQVPPNLGDLAAGSNTNSNSNTSWWNPLDWPSIITNAITRPFLSAFADMANYGVWIATTAGGLLLMGVGFYLLFASGSQTQAGNIARTYGAATKHIVTLPLRYARG